MPPPYGPISNTSPKKPPPILDEPVKISLAGDPVRGPENARLTIVEFSDFQCPYCSKAVAESKEILKQFPNDVRLVFKQFPLDSHSEAEFGAEVALAAQAQGKFWEMHDLLYAGFPDLSRERIAGYARQLKLDMNRFNADLASHKYRARVRSEEKEGEEHHDARLNSSSTAGDIMGFSKLRRSRQLSRQELARK